MLESSSHIMTHVYCMTVYYLKVFFYAFTKIYYNMRCNITQLLIEKKPVPLMRMFVFSTTIRQIRKSLSLYVSIYNILYSIYTLSHFLLTLHLSPFFKPLSASVSVMVSDFPLSRNEFLRLPVLAFLISVF